jgi:hypothetical protein
MVEAFGSIPSTTKNKKREKIILAHYTWNLLIKK